MTRGSWAALVVKQLQMAFQKNCSGIRFSVPAKDATTRLATAFAMRIATRPDVISTEAIVLWVSAPGLIALPHYDAGNCSRTKYATKNATTRNAFSMATTATYEVMCNHATPSTTPIARAITPTGDATMVVTTPNATGTDLIAKMSHRF
jgi:hypothetical protein